MVWVLAGLWTQTLVPKDDMIISGSVKLRPGTYRIKDVNGDGLFRITKADARLDLNGATIIGDGGVALAVSGAGVRVFNGVLKGFRQGVSASKAPLVTLLNLEISATEEAVDLRQSPKAQLEFLQLDGSGTGIRADGCPDLFAAHVSVGDAKTGISLSNLQGGFVWAADAFKAQTAFALQNVDRTAFQSCFAEQVKTGFHLDNVSRSFFGYSLFDRSDNGFMTIGGKGNWYISNTMRSLRGTCFWFEGGTDHVVGLSLIRDAKQAYDGSPETTIFTRSESVTNAPVGSNLTLRDDLKGEFPQRDLLAPLIERALEVSKRMPLSYRSARQRNR